MIGHQARHPRIFLVQLALAAPPISTAVQAAPAPAQTGTFPAKLSETGGWFGATFPTLSPYAIQFNADGP